MEGNNIDIADYTFCVSLWCKFNFTLFVLIILHYNLYRSSPFSKLFN